MPTVERGERQAREDNADASVAVDRQQVRATGIANTAGVKWHSYPAAR
jgi:hypothetical protein